MLMQQETGVTFTHSGSLKIISKCFNKFYLFLILKKKKANRTSMKNSQKTKHAHLRHPTQTQTTTPTTSLPSTSTPHTTYWFNQVPNLQKKEIYDARSDFEKHEWKQRGFWAAETPPADAILPPRALDKRLQEDWTKDAREGPRVLMSLRVDFGPMG